MTTLNCTHAEQETTPERRPIFRSLRKTGALSKAVRSRLSKSFYNNNNSQIKNKKNDKTVITVAPLVEEKNNGGTKQTNHPKLAAMMKSEKHKSRSKLCLLL